MPHPFNDIELFPVSSQEVTSVKNLRDFFKRATAEEVQLHTKRLEGYANAYSYLCIALTIQGV